MTNLPSSVKIPVLTPENVSAVAQAYLTRLDFHDVSETDRAVRFISTALTNLTERCSKWKDYYYRLDENFMQVLKYTPHFRRETVRALPENDVAEWADANGVEIGYLRHLAYDYYLFTSYDDAILFKMRWS